MRLERRSPLEQFCPAFHLRTRRVLDSSPRAWRPSQAAMRLHDFHRPLEILAHQRPSIAFGDHVSKVRAGGTREPRRDFAGNRRLPQLLVRRPPGPCAGRLAECPSRGTRRGGSSYPSHHPRSRAVPHRGLRPNAGPPTRGRGSHYPRNALDLCRNRPPCLLWELGRLHCSRECGGVTNASSRHG
jgi:hypothetical protein